MRGLQLAAATATLHSGHSNITQLVAVAADEAATPAAYALRGFHTYKLALAWFQAEVSNTHNAMQYVKQLQLQLQQQEQQSGAGAATAARAAFAAQVEVRAHVLEE